MTELDEKLIRRKTPEERLASIPEIPEGMDPIQRARVEGKINAIKSFSELSINIKNKFGEK